MSRVLQVEYSVFRDNTLSSQRSTVYIPNVILISFCLMSRKNILYCINYIISINFSDCLVFHYLNIMIATKWNQLQWQGNLLLVYSSNLSMNIWSSSNLDPGFFLNVFIFLQQALKHNELVIRFYNVHKWPKETRMMQHFNIRCYSGFKPKYLRKKTLKDKSPWYYKLNVVVLLGWSPMLWSPIFHNINL